MNEERHTPNAGQHLGIRLLEPKTTMTFEASYLAAENSAQERRSRSLYRFIVLSPMVLLLAVGIVGHLHKAPHVGSAGDSEYDRRVLAYRERVVAAGRLLDRTSPAPPAALEQEAQLWTAGFASGDLQPLPPAAFEDHLRDGVRGEIVYTNLSLAAKLSTTASESLAHGRPVDAVRQALLAAETPGALKYSEIVSGVQSVMEQRRALMIVLKAWPSVPDALRPAFRSRVKKLAMNMDAIDRMGETEVSQIANYAVRQKLGASSVAALAGAQSMEKPHLAAARHGAQGQNALIEKILRLD